MKIMPGKLYKAKNNLTLYEIFSLDPEFLATAVSVARNEILMLIKEPYIKEYSVMYHFENKLQWNAQRYTWCVPFLYNEQVIEMLHLNETPDSPGSEPHTKWRLRQELTSNFEIFEPQNVGK